MRFSLYEHAAGVETEAGNNVVYDVGRGEARFGAVGVNGRVLVWELGGDRDKALLSVEVELDPAVPWLARCDRIEFPAGAVAYRHAHPGPGMLYLLYGELHVDGPEVLSRTLRPGEAWFHAPGYPVLATAGQSGETAFVRVQILPAEWKGRRSIHYLDPADEDKPKLQRPTILLEQPIAR